LRYYAGIQPAVCTGTPLDNSHGKCKAKVMAYKYNSRQNHVVANEILRNSANSNSRHKE